ncbi:MAG: hypothetical protein HFI31_14865 [Lachnospiraceae bacterium]|nr:hypothetical protein [Lachnospiraceae bacterium]
MKNNILTDLKTSARLFLDIRKERKNWAEIVVEKKKVFPLIQTGGFYGTVEGCTLSHLDRAIVLKAQEAFKELPDEIKHQLQFLPKNGEFIERARFWRDILSPVMDGKQCHIAMLDIIHWYICIKKMDKEEARLSVC